MRVLVTDKINEIAKNILTENENIEVDVLPTMNEDELCEKISDYDALMIRSQTKVTKKVLDSGCNLKIVGRAGVGVDNIDVKSATEKGIIVVNSPDGNTKAAAEHAIAMMLSMARNIPRANESCDLGKWERSKFTGVEVYGKTLGIIGFGKIGSHVAKVACALGMSIIVCDPYTTKEKVESMGYSYIDNFDEFWGLCDFITIHTPKTNETTHLINENTISKMKDGVRIINCARGGIIDENALKEAILNGKVKSAAIDVYEDEPEIQKSPLLQVKENVVLTPHLGASTGEAQLNVAIDVAEQIREVLSGGSAKSPVNIPFLKPEKLEPVKDYMKLAVNLGELAQQISEGNLKEINIKFKGALASLDVEPLEIAILKGIFSVTDNNVNYVNSMLLAKNKGIDVTTSKSDGLGNYIGYISVKLITSEGETVVAGAMITNGLKRIVTVNEYETSIETIENMLFVPHVNKPSMIAQVATVIGEANINIEHMHVVQKLNDNSLMIINTGESVNREVLSKLDEIDGVENAKYIKLS